MVTLIITLVTKSLDPSSSHHCRLTVRIKYLKRGFGVEDGVIRPRFNMSPQVLQHALVAE